MRHSLVTLVLLACSLSLISLSVQSESLGFTGMTFAYYDENGQCILINQQTPAEETELRLALEYLIMLSNYEYSVFDGPTLTEQIEREMEANIFLNPILCTVIDQNEGQYISSFTIDKGTEDGIEPRMPVTLAGSLIGYVVEVEANQSIVWTIINPEASVPVFRMDDDLDKQGIIQGIAFSSDIQLCVLFDYPEDICYAEDDELYTTGDGFVVGIPVGTVTKYFVVDVKNGKLYPVVIPRVKFRHLDEVIVMRYRPGTDSKATVSPIITIKEGAENWFDTIRVTPPPAP